MLPVAKKPRIDSSFAFFQNQTTQVIEASQSQTSENMQLKFGDLYREACTETPYARPGLIAQMQALVDAGDVTIDAALLDRLVRPVSADLEEKMQQGFWIRMIGDSEQEKEILDIREGLSEHAVLKMGHTAASRKSLSYTPYSPANFVCHDACYALYEELGSAGLMIDTGEGPFAYWQDGTGYEMLSSHVDFRKKVLFNKDNYSKQFSNIRKSAILAHIQTLKSEYQQICLKKSSTTHINDARTGLSLDIPMLFQPRQWNEGLLRYKKSHIIGIYVDYQNKKSVLAGIQLQQTLNLSHLAFYGFSEFNHVLCHYSLDDLMKRHHLGPDFTAASGLLQLQSIWQRGLPETVAVSIEGNKNSL
jgi:hypothetical protein